MKSLNIAVIIGALLLVGCTSDVQQSLYQEKSLKEANAQIGMPAIKNFQERKLLKMILELRDQEDLITYAYIVNLNGGLVFIGKCIGFGIPYATQYTSPQKPESSYQEPQADPNGLFMPSSADGTWLMMLDDKGNARPVYCEPHVIVSPFPL